MILQSFSSKVRIPFYKNLRRFSTAKKSLFVWGSNKHGALGLGSNLNESVELPQRLNFPAQNVRSVVFGRYHSAIVTNSGKVYTFGLNDSFQLGFDSKDTDFVCTSPKKVEGLENVKSVVCGYWHSLALTDKGEIFSFGYKGNLFTVGALGYDRSEYVSEPRKITNPSNDKFVSVSAGDLYSIALTEENREIYGWGCTKEARLLNYPPSRFWNNGIISPTALKLFKNESIKSIYSKDAFSCVVMSDNTAYMWGNNNYNQLGMESILLNTQRVEIFPVKLVSDESKSLKIAQFDCSSRNCIALDENGLVYLWGRKKWAHPTKFEVKEIKEKIIQVGTANESQYILTDKGNLYGWGDSSTELKIPPLRHSENAIGKIARPSRIEFFQRTGNERVERIFVGDNRMAVLVKH